MRGLVGCGTYPRGSGSVWGLTRGGGGGRWKGDESRRGRAEMGLINLIIVLDFFL